MPLSIVLVTCGLALTGVWTAFLGFELYQAAASLF
jgi:hypothetical protein